MALQRGFIIKIMDNDNILKILQYFYLFFLVVNMFYLFLYRYRVENPNDPIRKLSYPAIGLILVLLLLYKIGQNKYQQQFTEFRNMIRDELNEVEYNDKVIDVQSEILPHFRWQFLKKWTVFTIIAAAIYLALSHVIFILELAGLVISVIVFRGYYQLLKIDSERLLHRYLV